MIHNFITLMKRKRIMRNIKKKKKNYVFEVTNIISSSSLYEDLGLAITLNSNFIYKLHNSKSYLKRINFKSLEPNKP